MKANSLITNPEEEAKRGKLLAEVLGLKKSRKTGMYSTQWGTKTDTGLFRTIERIVLDGE